MTHTVNKPLKESLAEALETQKRITKILETDNLKGIQSKDSSEQEVALSDLLKLANNIC